MATMSSSPTKLRLSRLHWPVTVLGFGRRVGIWFQGCSIHCRDCCSRDTWDTLAGALSSAEEVIRWIKSLPIDEIDGFTISGGEPFDQPDALMQLLAELRTVDGNSQRDILVYSGYPIRHLQSWHADIVEQVDVMISEPFVTNRKTAPLRGSDNQQILLMTSLARSRYASLPTGKRMQVCFDGEQMWMIGIPERRDLDRIHERLRCAGITLNDPSWH